MAASPYFAQYCTFKTDGREGGGYLLSADSLVGDLFDIVFEQVDGQRTACLHNKFGYRVGRFDQQITHKLLLCQADGWILHAILSAVFFSESKKSGYYWGEVALICYARRYAQEFDAFTDAICKQLRSGKRPLISLKQQDISTVLGSKGTWLPKDREPKRKLEPGTVVVKDYLKYDERLVEMAREKNIGCMVIGWAFIFALAALVFYIVWNIVPFDMPTFSVF